MPDNDFLIKKYEEIGENFRFFLTWRHASFSAMIFAVATGLSFILSNYSDGGKLLVFVPVVILFTILAFFVIDLRTRQLYRSLSEEGARIEVAMENGEGEARLGGYKALAKSFTHERKRIDKNWIQTNVLGVDHSAVINWFTFLSALAMAGILIHLSVRKKDGEEEPVRIILEKNFGKGVDTVVTRLESIPPEIKAALENKNFIVEIKQRPVKPKNQNK